MDRKDLEQFCHQLIKRDIIPVLAKNYAALHEEANSHGTDFFTNSNSTASFKNDGKGLVSDGEIEAERIIRSAFKKKFPEVSIYGEELGDEETKEGWVLVIDPVDGTSAMIESIINDQGKLAFGITLGFMYDHNFIGGIIYELKANAEKLILGDIFTGWKGQGATKNGRPLHCNKDTENLQNLYSSAPEVMFNTPNMRHAFHKLERNAENTHTQQNCIGFMHSIIKENACTIETDLSIHDIAALVPILKESGMVVSDLDGNPLTFKNIDSEYKILTAAPETHKHALNLYQNAIKEKPLEISKNSTLNKIATLNTQKFKT